MIFFFYWLWGIIPPNKTKMNTFWNSTKKLGATFIIKLSQLNCKAIFGAPYWICWRHLVLHHWPPTRIHKIEIDAYICVQIIPHPSFKYPWTQDLKSRIFLINEWMNGCSYGAINIFIKFTDIVVFLSQFLSLAKTSINVLMCMTNDKKYQLDLFKDLRC